MFDSLVVQTEPPANAAVEEQQPNEPPVIVLKTTFIIRKSLKIAVYKIYDIFLWMYNYCVSNHLN